MNGIWLVFAVLFLLLFIMFVIIISNSIFFNPLPQQVWSPAGIYEFEDLMIGGRIHAWYFHPYPNEATVLFCHGNKGNITHCKSVIDLCLKNHLNLIVFDYRGFGQSPGDPTQKGIKDDGLTVYHYLRDRGVNSDQIIVWGISLGGAVAAYIAWKEPVRCLILMSTFSSIDDIIRDNNRTVLGKIGATLSQAVTDMLDTKELIKEIKAPTLIVHSPNDELIPIRSARRLYNLSGSNYVELLLIDGSHASPRITVEQLEAIMEFCNTSCQYCQRESVEEVLEEIAGPRRW